MWITTFIMFTVSTCHYLLQWVGGMDRIRTELGSGFLENYYGEQLLSIADIYLPIINVSSWVSLFSTPIAHFAVFVERRNRTLEGMGYVGTQRESPDISCLVLLRNYS